jgi:hypothetical protein
MMKSHIFRSFTLSVVLTCLATNCLAKHEKEPPPDPKLAAIKSIALLPVVDARADKTTRLNLNTGLNPAPARMMARACLHGQRHYQVTLVDFNVGAGEPSLEDLQEAKPEFIKQLGPPTERWVMIIVVADANSRAVLGRVGAAEILGFIYDKETETLIWKGTSVGTDYEGGLIFIGAKGYTERNAVVKAVYSLIETLPKQ